MWCCNLCLPGDLSIYFVKAVWLENGFWLNLLQSGFWQVSRETFEDNDDMVIFLDDDLVGIAHLLQLTQWMAGNLKEYTLFSKWNLNNVQRPRSNKGDMVLFSNQNHYRRDWTEMTPNLAHLWNQGWIWQANSTQSSHNSNNMEKSTLTHQTVAHALHHEHLSRKQKRQLFNKVGDLTINADYMMKEYDAVEEEEEDAQCTMIKMEESTGRTKFTTSSNASHQNPPSLPSSIKVKHSSNSHVSSSVPGLSSFLDMSMTEIGTENQVTMVRKCVQKHIFPQRVSCSLQSRWKSNVWIPLEEH